MCKQNYNKYIKPQNGASPKKYLYCLRGLMNALYVKEYLQLPPIKFPATLAILRADEKINIEIYNILMKIIKNKREELEGETIENISILDDYIENQLKIDESPDKRHYCLPGYFNNVIIPLIHRGGN